MTRSAALIDALNRRFPGYDSTFDVDDYLYAHGEPLLALLYAKLFRPNFIEVDGMVFEATESSLETAFGERVRMAFEQYSRDPEMTQRAFNFVEVPCLFALDPDHVDGDLLRDLSLMMLEAWEDRLRRQFPSYTFDCEMIEPTEHEDVGFVFFRVFDLDTAHSLARQSRRHRQYPV